MFQREEFNGLRYETVRAIAVMAGMPEYLENMEDYKVPGEERYRMCTAIREIRNESREEGREQGRIIEYVNIRREDGYAEKDILSGLMERFRLTRQQAEEYLIMQ